MHPDPYYTPQTSLSTACHRKKSKKKKNKSLYFGTPYSWVILSHPLPIEHSHHQFSECDSPLRLTNLTLDFLNDDWAPEIDFVICSSFSLSLNQSNRDKQGQAITPGGYILHINISTNVLTVSGDMIMIANFLELRRRFMI